MAPVDFERSVSEALASLKEARIIERLWAKDANLWKSEPEHVAIINNALGWLDLPMKMQGEIEGILAFSREVREAGIKHIILLGMGGSSLAPLVYSEIFGSLNGYPSLIVLDSTDPDAIKSAEEKVRDLSTALFIVSSKSGTTIEPMSAFEYFFSKLSSSIGDKAASHFVAITDPGTKLESLAKSKGFRKTFLNPHDIGGRYSALSFFGLVPAALTGIDIERLLYNAGVVAEDTFAGVDESENPTIMLGAALGALHNAGRDKITFFLAPEIQSFGLWIEQLIAESTGKEGKGLLPITGEAPLSPEEYAEERAFIYIGAGVADSKFEKSIRDLVRADFPTLHLRIGEDLYEIGGEFYRWEVATAVAGRLIGINPFDQPDVELAKKLAQKSLAGEAGSNTEAPMETDFPNVSLSLSATAKKAVGDNALASGAEGALKGFLNVAKKYGYLGLLAYVNPFDAELAERLAMLREAVRKATKVPIQFGYGPRYLHSTGQIHKGGKDGAFLIITLDSGSDVRTPGAKYSFHEIEASQAAGDFSALDAKAKPSAMLRLSGPSIDALDEAIKFISGT